jgi:hypothetical protein
MVVQGIDGRPVLFSLLQIQVSQNCYGRSHHFYISLVDILVQEMDSLVLEN